MGRKLKISQPAVIQTELRPLDESFWIDANGRTEQWYYQNTNAFAPDRQITPLILTPYLSAVDRDTNTKYTPTFQLDSWVVKEYIDGAWVTTTITSQSQTSDYVLQGLNLIVKKNNYDATHAINITCKATYQDPRDVGVLKGVEDSVMLVTSVDATQQFPKIDIVNPATRTYNPLKDESPIYEFKGKADWEGVEAQGGTAITECKVDPLGTEEILPTNEEMVINAAPTLNIHYGDIEKSNQQFMYRQTANGEVEEIAGGVSAIDNIKGNTVKFNQIINWSKVTIFWNIATKTVSGLKITFTGNSGAYGVLYQNSGTPNHKYYQSVIASASVANTNLHCDGNLGGYIQLSTTPKRCAFLSKTTSNSTTLSFVIYNDGNYSTNSIIFENQYIIDLTLMFGAGNEPSTVEEFETWLATNIGLKDYYEYCSGKLVNFGGYGVKWNQLQVKLRNVIVESEGVTFTVRDNKTIVANGTANSNALFDTVNSAAYNWNGTISLVAGHKYFLKGCPSGGSSSTFQLTVIQQTSNWSPSYTDTGSGCLFTPNSEKYWMLALVINGTTVNNIEFKPVLVDLTLMFGTGNEPDLEWCNKYLSRDYYDYCPSVEKNILDVMTTKEVIDGVAQYKSPEMGVKTTGFNQWDEEWEVGDIDSNGNNKQGSGIRAKNFCSALPNTQYFTNDPSTLYVIYFYDANKQIIPYTGAGAYMNGYNGGAQVFTTPANTRYFRFRTSSTYGSTYNNDICINISDPSRNGTYEPHWESKSDMSWITKIGIENFNIWDEEWESGAFDNSTGENQTNSTRIRSTNYIPVSPNTRYCTNGKYEIIVMFYDASKSILQYVKQTGDAIVVNKCADVYPNTPTFTTPNNCAFIKFFVVSCATYAYDICINKSISAYNGKYLPHGQTMPYFPNGLCKVGSVFDEIKVENGKIKGVVRIGSMDLGSGQWATSYDRSNWCFWLGWSLTQRGTASKNYTNAKYLIGDVGATADSASGNDKTLRSYTDGIYIKDTAYTDAAKFQAANQGVMLYYELATSYEFEIDYPTKGQFEWYGINGSGQEVPIDQLPVYTHAEQPSGYGQGTNKININALYGEDIAVILRVKRYPWSPTVLPPKVTKSVAWSVPPIDVITTSDKGSAVRATNSSDDFIFSTIVNQQGEIISEEKKAENMVFDWYMVKYGTSGAVKTSQGSGLTKSIPASTLKNTTPSGGVTPSTNVYCEAFLLGAYHLVDGQYVRTKD